MNELTPIIQPQQLPSHWNYEISVKKVRGFVYKWNYLTNKLFIELDIANRILSAQGRRTDIDANAPKLTWEKYCRDIGSVKSTVNRWLQKYRAPELTSKISDCIPYNNKWF